MKLPFVIAINSISGGGKTALAISLATKLRSCTVFHFDDFDGTNIYPDDFVEWWKRGAVVDEFDFPGMDKAVRNCLKRGDVEIAILDYPFSRLHPRFRDIIDFSVFIDTPADVALCRRILRHHLSDKKCLDTLRAELTSYLSKTRDVYLDSARRYRDEADLILDGSNDIATLTTQTIKHVKAHK